MVEPRSRETETGQRSGLPPMEKFFLSLPPLQNSEKPPGSCGFSKSVNEESHWADGPAYLPVCLVTRQEIPP